jgi:hypothetical protein
MTFEAITNFIKPPVKDKPHITPVADTNLTQLNPLQLEIPTETPNDKREQMIKFAKLSKAA